MRTPLTLLVLTGIAVAALTACTPDGGDQPAPSVPSTQSADAGDPDDTATSSAPQPGQGSPVASSLQPGEEVPSGMDVHDVKVFQVAIPSDWTAEEPSDEPTLAFWGEEIDGAPAEGAMVRWDPQGTSARQAAEEFEAELAGEGTTATVEELDWPDVQDGGAYLVTFDGEMAPGATRHVQQIFADLPQGGTGSLIGFALPEDFDSSRVPAVLGSFRVAP